MSLSETILIDTATTSKTDAVSRIVKAFLRGQTASLNDVVLADYCPLEGLRFEDMSGQGLISYVAVRDGDITDLGQSAFDLYEYVVSEELARPAAINAWTGNETDTTWKSSIPPHW